MCLHLFCDRNRRQDKRKGTIPKEIVLTSKRGWSHQSVCVCVYIYLFILHKILGKYKLI